MTTGFEAPAAIRMASFDGIVGRSKGFGELGLLQRDQLRDLVDRGIGFFLAIGVGAYGRSAFAQVAWRKSGEIGERQHIF